MTTHYQFYLFALNVLPATSFKTGPVPTATMEVVLGYTKNFSITFLGPQRHCSHKQPQSLKPAAAGCSDKGGLTQGRPLFTEFEVVNRIES